MQAANKVNLPKVTDGRVARMGLALANWSERWFPDPLVFAFLGVLVVYALGVLAGESPTQLGIEAGRNFWTLVPFTMQMVMIIVGGYVVASTPSGAARHTLAGRNPHYSPRSNHVGRVRRHHQFPALLGTQPDHQRLPGPRDDRPH